MTGNKIAGWLSVLLGLALLVMSLTQWNNATGSTMGRALSDYNHGDAGDLRVLRGETDLSTTERVGTEAIAGLFWVAIGGVLLRKAGLQGGVPTRRNRLPPMRR